MFLMGVLDWFGGTYVPISEALLVLGKSFGVGTSDT